MIFKILVMSAMLSPASAFFNIKQTAKGCPETGCGTNKCCGGYAKKTVIDGSPFFSLEEACINNNEANRWRAATTALADQRYYYCAEVACPSYTKRQRDQEFFDWLGWTRDTEYLEF